MNTIYILSLTTENTLRVLQRISTVFSRNRINIEQLNVCETQRRGTSHFNIIIHSDAEAITKLVKQLKRIIELVDIQVSHQIALERKPEEVKSRYS